MSDWASRSQSYRRGYVAGEQGDENFARLIDGATDRTEAMQGYADGLASVNESDERERFKAWVKSTSAPTWPHSFDMRHGKYVNNWHQARWEAWQAALTFGVNHGDTQNDGLGDYGQEQPG